MKTEKECDKCAGKGTLLINIHYASRYSLDQITMVNCDKCDGSGILTWIDEVISKNHNPYPIYTKVRFELGEDKVPVRFSEKMYNKVKIY
jgi:hypothetical protein